MADCKVFRIVHPKFPKLMPGLPRAEVLLLVSYLRIRINTYLLIYFESAVKLT